jgi:hypothetical protein
MPRRRPGPAPIVLALTVYDIWRRLPPAQRRQLAGLARKHGPTVASKVYKAARGTRMRPR